MQIKTPMFFSELINGINSGAIVAMVWERQTMPTVEEIRPVDL